MRLTKCFLILLFSCLIFSCSLVRTAYNKAPELAIWWLDDYFNLTKTQKSALIPSLQSLHEWHRQTQLSSYITLLQELQTSLSKEKISATDTCEKINTIKQSIYTLQIEAIPVIVKMASLLSDKQLIYFQQSLVKRTEKWKSEWWQETKAEQLKVRLEKTQDFAEKVYGDLNDDQLNQLKQSFTKISIDPAISYAEIQRRNDDAFIILGQLQNQSLTYEEKTQLVKAGFDRIQKSSNQAYQTYTDKLAIHTCETFANLHASTTAKQKLHAKNWLADYIELLKALNTR